MYIILEVSNSYPKISGRDRNDHDHDQSEKIKRDVQ